jgi:alcohol dehydrogenase (cytochrome c)
LDAHKLACAIAALVFISLPVYAQSPITGTWRAQGVGDAYPWDVVLAADGSGRVTGAVSSCSSVRRAFEIFDSTVDGDTIAFKCRSGDGQRTVEFRGVISDGQIAFTWQKQVMEGGRRGPADGLFGDSDKPQFTVQRVPDGGDEVTQMADLVRRRFAVTFDRVVHANEEPNEWLTYSGNLLGHRHSLLTQITPANVKNLEIAWLWQGQSSNWLEATPLVSGGILYTVQPTANQSQTIDRKARPQQEVIALDAATGRVMWTYAYTPKAFRVQPVNRGLAILGSTLFMGTLDAHLLAINARDGTLMWDAPVANAADPSCLGGSCYAITHAPLVVKDKVIVGTSGGEGRVRGFVAAFDASTGKEVWRFSTVPAPGEPGNETWSGDSWRFGGAAVWNTGSYDADLNLTYWGTGNPAPNGSPDSRLGDNLYSDSVIALDADTGRLRWHYQFTPHDDKDWDSTQVPVLTDMQWQGRLRKVMLWANRNGMMYVLDRATGEFLMGKPFVEVNWMSGFDGKGRPIRVPLKPGEQPLPSSGAGATNWPPPSYSPRAGLFYIPSLEEGATPRYGAMRAFDPQTGEKKWEFKKESAAFYGALTTASDLLFTGVRGDFGGGNPKAERTADGHFYALDARTGQLLWQMGLAGSVQCAPMSYWVGNKQYIAITAGNTLFAFALPQ